MANHLLWCLYFYAAYYQFESVAIHVLGVLNVAADALSRGNLTLFNFLIPQAAQWQVPVSLLELLVTRRPDWGSTDWIRLFTSTLQAH